MNGIHDMGGLHGFGPVEKEVDEPVFHARWEARVLSITQVLDTRGIYSLDEHRHEIELMDTPSYLTAGYYGRWLFAMESILDRKHVLKRDEVEQRIQDRAHDAMRLVPPQRAQRNWPIPAEKQIPWGAWRKDVAVVPLFKVGDRVRAKNLHPPGHTRLTNYVRNHVGTIHLVNANAWVFPDTRAHERGENLQPVYNVEFDATSLWGPEAEPNVKINVDLSEAYLELTA